MDKTQCQDVTFVIPHKDRHDLLAETILSIRSLHYSQQHIEIVVVSKSTDIKDIMGSILKENNVITLPANNAWSISKQRNEGAYYASSELIAFLDADIALSQNWLNEMLTLLESNSEIGIVSAVQKASKQNTHIEDVRVVLCNAYQNTFVDGLAGANLFLRKETFEQAKGFPENLSTCEDIYFTQAVNRFSKLYQSSNAYFIHLGEDKTLQQLFKKEMWRGKSNISSIEGRTIALREYPSIIIPPLTAVAFFGIILAFIINSSPLMFSSAVVFSMFPFVYSCRLQALNKQTFIMLKGLVFYAIYFPARGIGMLKHMFDNIFKQKESR